MSKTAGQVCACFGFSLICYKADYYGYRTDRNIHDQSNTKLRSAILAGVTHVANFDKITRKLKQRRRLRRQRERQTRNKFRLANNNIVHANIFVSVHFFDMKLCVYFHLLGMTWMQDNDLRFLFLNFWTLEFHSSWIRQHVSNLTRWNKRDKIWSSASSLFKCRFCSRRCCLSFLLILYARTLRPSLRGE